MRPLFLFLLLSFVAPVLSQAEEPLKVTRCEVTTPPLGDLSQILKICATTCSFELAKPVSKIQVIIDAYPRGVMKPVQLVQTGITVPAGSTKGAISLQIANLAHLPLADGKEEQLFVSDLFQFGNSRAGSETKVEKKTFDITYGIGGSKFQLNAASTEGKTPLFYIIGSPKSHLFNSISTSVTEVVQGNPTATILVVSIAPLP